MRALLALLVTTGLLAGFVLPAHAQQVCGMYDSFAETLKTQHGETRHGTGVTANNWRIELLENRNAQTWTMLVISGSGRACVVASGVSWEDEPRGIRASDPTEPPWGQLRWTWRNR